MSMNTATYTLPSFWSSYLINGDASGLTVPECAAINKFMEDNCLLGALSYGDDEEFRHMHDATDYGVLSCDCMEFTFPVNPNA